MVLSLLRKRAEPAPPTEARTEPGSDPAAGFAAVVRELADHSSGIAREAAAMRGALDDVAAIARGEAGAFEVLGAEVGTMIDSNASIATAVESSRRSALAAKAAVERVANDVSGALESLREVAQAAADITRIALQTRLVAFNAAVEAKHAGEAGRGFAVVAEAVKELSQKVESSSKAIGSTVQQLDQRIGELARNIRDDTTLADGEPSFSRAFARVVDATGEIEAVTGRNQQACDATRASLARLQDEVHGTARALEDARDRTESFLGASEFLTRKLAGCGARTVDTPFIDKAIEVADVIAAAFSRAVAAGEISVDDLFDEAYEPIAGSAPQQHMTRFVGFTDRVLPAIQEAVLGFSDKVVFCAAVDRNGYLPTHNRKFSQRPRADAVWNAAHCRNRRIFNDRTGLGAGRNRERFLLQTYRRDMGGGEFKLMKDVSAPIVVDGRHWGGVRVAYTF